MNIGIWCQGTNIEQNRARRGGREKGQKGYLLGVTEANNLGILLTSTCHCRQVAVIKTNTTLTAVFILENSVSSCNGTGGHPLKHLISFFGHSLACLYSLQNDLVS